MKSKVLCAVAAVGMLLAMVLGGPSAAHASNPVAPAAFQVPTSLDLHDGMVARFGGTYYAYGTEYGCGYHWYQANTPWCGFGVSTAPSLTGPWSVPKLLFSAASTDPWTGQSWQTECGSTGQGCFNPRMVQRTGWGANDGVSILWFNSPLDTTRNGANSYNAMGCTGPDGPCGVGAPGHGSYTKPSLHYCTGNDDFGFIASGTAGQAPAMVCAMGGTASLSAEQMDYWGVGGSGSGGRNLAGLTGVEGDGGWYDAATATYVITYSGTECGYCTGNATGYATAKSLLGPYTAPVDVAAAAPPAGGRRDISATSCGGQPRTVSVVNSVPYQGIDLWTGGSNETGGGVLYSPLTYKPTASPVGGVWIPPVSYPC